MFVFVVLVVLFFVVSGSSHVAFFLRAALVFCFVLLLLMLRFFFCSWHVVCTCARLGDVFENEISNLLHSAHKSAIDERVGKSGGNKRCVATTMTMPHVACLRGRSERYTAGCVLFVT